MSLDRRTREQMQKYCGAIHDDDGVDPREYSKVRKVRRGNDRKDRQLCRQVALTLDQVLSGETEDGVLRGLGVASVVPAPNSSRLLVTLEPRTISGDWDRELAELRIAACEGRLRCAVADAITRRKTPQLVFNIIGGQTPPALPPFDHSSRALPPAN